MMKLLQNIHELYKLINEDVRPADQGIRPADQGIQPADQGVHISDQGVRPADQGTRKVDESLKVARTKYLDKGLISQEDFDKLAKVDPTPQKKYLPKIIQWYLDGVNIDSLSSTITEFDVFVDKHIVKGEESDINRYKKFEDLHNKVEELNKRKTKSQIKSEKKKGAEVIIDNKDLFVVIPETHEASCVYGKGTKWCTAANTNVHWNNYYLRKNATFYYIQVRSERLKKKLGDPSLWKVALLAMPDGTMNAYSAVDKQINAKTYLEKIGFKF